MVNGEGDALYPGPWRQLWSTAPESKSHALEHYRYCDAQYGRVCNATPTIDQCQTHRNACRTRSFNAAICVHNHASGDPSPSKQDLELTARLRDVGQLVGIPLLDHLVVVRGARWVSTP